jgi:ElaB/YqjD/DUF883 family membrane-anchored ribosome-binding protein
MPRAHSSDVPRYDTYPAPTPSEAASTPQDWPYEPRTDLDRTQVGNPRLNQTAENIGETLGRVVAITRSVRGRVDRIKRDATAGGTGLTAELKQRASELGEEARARMEDLRSQVEERIAGAREAASVRIDGLRDQARRGLENGRERARARVEQARQYAHDNPLPVIAGAALAGIALGVGLRLWRSRHD